MTKLLIKQPGRVGDILICLPIAKWYYLRNYEVEWLCPEQYHSVFRNIDYCKPVKKETGKYDKVIDLSFGLVHGTEIDTWWEAKKKNLQSFVVFKYQIAGVPLMRRWELNWRHDIPREFSLYSKIRTKYGPEYTVVQEKTHNYATQINASNKVLFEPFEDFNIFDWYQVLMHAKEIHCIDSCLCNFVEVIPELMSKPKFYYSMRWGAKTPYNTLLVNNWTKK